jgi:hypothetical protein
MPHDSLPQNPARARSVFSKDSEPYAPEPSAAPVNLPANKKVPVVGAALVGVVVLVALVAAVMEMKEVLEPFLSMIDFSSPITPAFTLITTQQNGDVISVQMKTDNGHADRLCNQVMEEIYAEAGKNPSAQQLKLTLQVEGKNETTVQVDDLDAVRKYRNQTTYENSGHRRFVGANLVDADLIDQSSLDVPASADGDADIVGNFYVTGPQCTSQLGLKFITETQVEFYADGAHYATCNYTESGDSITIPTSCSTMHLQKDGDDLVDDRFGRMTRH